VDEAIALADRVIVLDAGRIVTEEAGGDPAEIRTRLLAALGVTA
jgi:ABC-type proline/glycine betaine transport system ATPase subunit